MGKSRCLVFYVQFILIDSTDTAAEGTSLHMIANICCSGIHNLYVIV